jgi:hypothetical protein
MILDKAISIQRMVGYLQLMENDTDRKWKWEYHLNIFREKPGKSSIQEPHRKHRYVFNVALMLLILNAISSALYAWGPDAVALRATSEYQSLREFYGAVHLLVLVLNFYGIYIAIHRWRQLVYGPFKSSAIQARWLEVLNSDSSMRN